MSGFECGGAQGRVLNLYQRHGDRVKICTAADFNGTRWTTNALMLTMPQGPCYLLPAGAVMRLFKRYNGTHAVTVRKAPANVDIAASRTGETFFLHVANMEYSRSVSAQFSVDEMRVAGGRIVEIASDDPRQAIGPKNADVFEPREHVLPPGRTEWRFPARSVSAVVLRCVEG